ncbi:hypothetical protein [Frondihabitans sp. VKM Ac-2883]|uniref:hypothetical protein n=1 Tax=Frondihabitans sp. VKM Ac-2883 TaxID=2783823 RepID=UPI00188B3CB4|nr:hypothetical protein [Frondihabitans sp. VKM Ac-2883]MBF4577266.1 hypothetical protein [Frondihabitans sp. VKM Ac-2883]
MRSSTTRRRRLDSVHLRCAAACALVSLSLVLVIIGTTLSLVPMAVGIFVLTFGTSMKDRNAPPITFLVLLPIIGIIVWILIARAT